MPKKEKQGFPFAMLRREAGNILERDANRLKLIQAIMISVTPLLLYLLFDSAFRLAILPRLDYFSDPVPYVAVKVAYRLFLYLFALFVAFPLLTGPLQMAQRMVLEEDVYLPEVFGAFSSAHAYRRAIRISLPVLVRIGLLVEVEALVYRGFESLAHGNPFVMLIAVPAYLGVALLWMLLCMRGFWQTYVNMTGDRGAVRMRPYAFWAGWSYWIGFFPWLVLSLLTVGICLLADVLPRMLVAYCYLGGNLNEAIRRKEIQHE